MLCHLDFAWVGAAILWLQDFAAVFFCRFRVVFPKCRADLDAGFSCRICQRRVVVLVSIWMFLWCFCLKILELIMFYDFYSQWIFRKVYGGWRLWILCVFLREKRFIMRFYARSFWVLPGYARGIFSIIGKWNPILVGFAKRSGVDLKLKHFADI